jgi:hypothetical protein
MVKNTNHEEHITNVLKYSLLIVYYIFFYLITIKYFCNFLIHLMMYFLYFN